MKNKIPLCLAVFFICKIGSAQAPIANFIYSNCSYCITLTDSSSNAPTQWHWLFGDGDSSSQQNPNHCYNGPGAYFITEIVSNIFGSDTTTVSINIFFQQSLNLSIGGNGVLCKGQTTIINILNITCPVISYQWLLNGNVIPGETLNYLVVDSQGGYSAVVVNQYHQTDTTPQALILVNNCNNQHDTCFNLQAPVWLWAKSSSGGNDPAGNEANAVITDAQGNVYVAGFYSFTPATIGSVTLPNSGGADVFVAKFDSSGNLKWVKRFGGSDDEEATCLTVDETGNVYVGGYFASSYLTLGSATLTNTTAGDWDVFVAKLDSNGTVIWAKSAGSTGSDAAYSICTAGANAIYLSGSWGGLGGSTITFGSQTFNNFTTGGADMFVAKYNGEGQVIWARSAGSTDDDYGYAVASDVHGNCFVGGRNDASPISFGTITAAGGGATDMFVVKYDSAGNAIWATCSGGDQYDWANSITTDMAGNIYAAGGFNSNTINFGSVTLQHQTGNQTDMFLVKYNSDGLVVWANGSEGSADDAALYVSTDDSSYCYISVEYGLGTFTYCSNNLESPNGYSAAVLKLDSSGNVLWGQTAGQLTVPYIYNIPVAPDFSGNVYMASGFQRPTLSLGSDTLTAAACEMFVAKLGYTTSADTTAAITRVSSMKDITIYPNPASGKLFINAPSLDENCQVSIFNILGEKILTEKIALKPAAGIDIANFSPGVYLIEVGSNENRFVKKVVIE